MHSHTFKSFDIVIAPFPFIDKTETKNRPLVILSTKSFSQNNHAYICAMITSALHSSWHQDCPIEDLKKAGLLKPSIIRLKLFTLDALIIKNVIGTLSGKDQKNLLRQLKNAIQLTI